jgi:hypothetical protein
MGLSCQERDFAAVPCGQVSSSEWIGRKKRKPDPEKNDELRTPNREQRRVQHELS